MQDNPDIIKLLLDSGADDTLTDEVGRNPLKFAEEHYKEKAKKALKNYKK